MQIHNNPETLGIMPPVRNCPRFVELMLMVVDGRSSYFLFMEQAVVCSVQSFTKVLLWFALHYIFNLEYDKMVGEVVFFQKFVFGLPCPAMKTAMYLATSTDIQKLTLK